MSIDEALRALVNTIIRDCCESETSDPERDDTIMIREGTLREILERALLTTRQEVAPVAMRIALPPGGTLGWEDYDAERVAKLKRNGWTVELAYPPTGQTSDARDGELLAAIKEYRASEYRDPETTGDLWESRRRAAIARIDAAMQEAGNG